MKIGILTFHNADNYGAVLQCYALQEYLKKQFPGDEVCAVDHKNPLIEQTYKAFPFVWKKKRGFFANVLRFGYWCFLFPERKRGKKAFNDFRKNMLVLENGNLNDYDAIFYGSDQIWNRTIVGNDDVFFGANFEGRKFAYAASDGGELLLDESTLENLKSFKLISCREDSLSKRLLAGGLAAQNVCDPVLLLSKDEWNHFAKNPEEKGYLLAYQMSFRPDFNDKALRLGKKLEKKVIQIYYVRSLRQFFVGGQKAISAITPQQFVGYFSNADFVFTTSFHGTAFSILFEKPFYVLSFEKRSERITDLLKTVGLENRFIESLPEEKTVEIYTEIIKEKIALYRKKSEDFMTLCAKNIGGGYKCIVILAFPSSSLSCCSSSSWRCAA